MSNVVKKAERAKLNSLCQSGFPALGHVIVHVQQDHHLFDDIVFRNLNNRDVLTARLLKNNPVNTEKANPCIVHHINVLSNSRSNVFQEIQILKDKES